MIEFTKMHGLGNDYVYVDCFWYDLSDMDMGALARAISDRHRGVGSDGLILILPPRPDVEADARMEMYNADGSRSEMCGNGLRCVAKFVVDHGLAYGIDDDNVRRLAIDTDRGVLGVECFLDQGKVARVRVDMSAPILEPKRVPVTASGERCIRMPLAIPTERGTVSLNVTCVSMGNPHAVAFIDDVAGFDLRTIGPLVERHTAFPNRVNFHVAHINSRSDVTMRTWERGAGTTQACGTGACGVLVAGVMEKRIDRRATLHLPGGDLEIEWAGEGDDGAVYMTGPATEVFTGQWDETSAA